MWNTSCGCRVLQGDEARLVRDATRQLADEIRGWISLRRTDVGLLPLGIPIFDRLLPEQQIVMLNTVLGYLFDPNLDPPKSNALFDATVAAIYAHAFCEIEIELDSQRLELQSSDGDTDYRKLVVAALMEPIDSMDDERTNWPDPECCDPEIWLSCIERLREQVLADEDWLMGDLTMDLPVDRSDELKKKLGIDRDYFIAVPPDPTLAETRQAWADLQFKVSGKRVAVARFGDQPFELVDLSSIVDELEMQLEDWCSYVNKQTGKVVSVPLDSIEYYETCDPEQCEVYAGEADEEMLEEARQIVEGNHHVPLPSSFDFNEWDIMREFAVSRVKPAERDPLYESIHGSGAFRFFRSTVERLGLRDEWHRFRDVAKETFVMDWGDAHEIAWIPNAEYQSIFRVFPENPIDYDAEF